ncbi:MAG: hypothetical protein QOE86_4259 [Solirubrobacteraceae bacterium]|jgi:DNA-3-methyladenine glycosylase II|nr:hypothetical protein [Solirubrobacteraceae bacterium]
MRVGSALRHAATVPGFTIHPTGAFDLAAAAGFGFGPTTGADRPAEPRMALAFCTDDLAGHAGVELIQDPAGEIRAEVQGGADLAMVERQVARVLSLDHDGAAWAAVGERDPVIGRLQAELPGLRPVLFHSPYEGAAWAIISARRPAGQAATTRFALAQALGATFQLHGHTLGAFPAPERLLEVEPMPGLPEVKAQRLRELARAAIDGRLDQPALIALDPEEALARMRELPGIGPFYASLIVVRALGHADVLAPDEPITKAATERYYGTDDVRAVGDERWRPFRTWASVLVHAAGRRAGLRAPPRR